MKILCSTKVDKTLDEYFALEPTVVFIKNLNYNGGYDLIKAAMNDSTVRVRYTTRGRPPKGKWLSFFIVGNASMPRLYEIKMSNGVVFRDYSAFDKKEDATLEDMQAVAEVLARYNFPKTLSGIIRSNLTFLKLYQPTNKYNMPQSIDDEDRWMFARGAKFGGATYIFPRYRRVKIAHETHIDFHQMYAYIMSTRPFPSGVDYTIREGYEEHPMAVYHITGGRIKLKPNGNPLLTKNEKDWNDWCNIVDSIGPYLLDIDLKLILENYDVRDIEVSHTFYYNHVLSGDLLFKDKVDELYQQRQAATNAGVKRLFKLINEYMPGTFERSTQPDETWRDLTGPGESKKPLYYDCILGDFITAYGRQLLNSVLKILPHNKVIGYDTDGIFLAMTQEEVERIPGLKQWFGDNPGQLHYDGVFTGTYHFAPKQYIGLDDGVPFGKMAGVNNADEVAQAVISNDYHFYCAPGSSVNWCWSKTAQNYVQKEKPIKIDYT